MKSGCREVKQSTYTSRALGAVRQMRNYMRSANTQKVLSEVTLNVIGQADPWATVTSLTGPSLTQKQRSGSFTGLYIPTLDRKSAHTMPSTI
ncbi:hypothetical protein FS837_006639 [Tulasnella sp. UAMH 9824]|nr:hypothetical protein FS837_006639 [Tulasnella sp. UAMH 9824]